MSQPTKELRRAAFGVFAQFWGMVNSGDAVQMLRATDVIAPHAQFNVTGLGELGLDPVLGYGRRWFKKYGPLGSPELSEIASIGESDNRQTAIVVLRCAYRKTQNGTRVIPYSERTATDHTMLMVHDLTLDEEGMICRWDIVVQNVSLVEQIS